MHRRLPIFLAFLLTAPLFAETRQRYTITTGGAVRPFAMRAAAHAQGEPGLRLQTFANLDGFAADLTEAEAEALRSTPGVESVDPVVPRYAHSVKSNFETYDDQQVPWGVPVIHAMDVWPVTKGEGINVVVMDTGIDFDHPDLARAYVGGGNVLSTNSPMDDNFHGTHVAGTIAATNNDFGVVGIAPNVRLWALKALDQSGKGYDATLAAGFDWVISKKQELGGRWVINCSFGSTSEGGKLERQAVARAIAEGIVIVASAGNNGFKAREFPAQYPNVIAVGAVGEDGRRADFSNYGNDIHVVAPGVLVQSTLLEGFIDEARVAVGGQILEAFGLLGSPKASVTGKIVYCKLGNPEDFPAAVAGNVALIQRGALDFRDKARNAKTAGATAVVIYDNQTVEQINWKLTVSGCPDAPTCPAQWKNYQFPLTIGISKADGEKLRAMTEPTAEVTFRFAQYGRLSGTSMSAPHVSAVAALMLSLDPTLSVNEVARIMRNTARDTGDPGWDMETGFGIVDALAAAKYVAPEKFNAPPPETGLKRRTVRP